LERRLFIIAIIDAELAYNQKHNFPNLACMKLSAYYKAKGEEVMLKTDYENLAGYEKVYISKVFGETKISYETVCMPNVIIGGTGFFYGTKPELPEEIEHIMPDYSLYDSHVNKRLENAAKTSSLKHYTDYSIGFLTRGCFRKCSFCVNRDSDRCVTHAPFSEFYDPDRKKIMLLDDNVLANPKWRELFFALMEAKKKFTFKQGIDIRLVSTDFAKTIDNANYDGDIYFSFDNIADSEAIESKLKLLRQYTDKAVRMYILCGFDYEKKYTAAFWLNDIESIFKRLEIIGRYGVTPFLMRFKNYIDSPYSGLYKNLASYCNKGGLFKTCTFEEYCLAQEARTKSGNCSITRYYNDFAKLHPEFVSTYFRKKFWYKGKST